MGVNGGERESGAPDMQFQGHGLDWQTLFGSLWAGKLCCMTPPAMLELDGKGRIEDGSDRVVDV
jgi:hypothetical protein